MEDEESQWQKMELRRVSERRGKSQWRREKKRAQTQKMESQWKKREGESSEYGRQGEVVEEGGVKESQ